MAALLLVLNAASGKFLLICWCRLGLTLLDVFPLMVFLFTVNGLVFAGYYLTESWESTVMGQSPA